MAVGTGGSRGSCGGLSFWFSAEMSGPGGRGLQRGCSSLPVRQRKDVPLSKDINTPGVLVLTGMIPSVGKAPGPWHPHGFTLVQRLASPKEAHSQKGFLVLNSRLP